MFKPLIVICVTFSLAANALGQTASELAKRYVHHEVYEVKPGIQMTARFAANGLVCEMKVEQERFLKDSVDMRPGIDADEIDRLIDHLVPKAERGEKDKGPNGMSIGGGQVGETIWRYANVEVHVISTQGDWATNALIISWRHRRC